MGVKWDCDGLEKGGCKILMETLCVTRGQCPFYKTKEQAKRDREKAQKRIDAIERGEIISPGLNAKPREATKEKPKRERGEYMAQRLEKMKAEGKCPYCGKKNDRPGKTRCSACSAREMALRKARAYFLGE